MGAGIHDAEEPGGLKVECGNADLHDGGRRKVEEARGLAVQDEGGKFPPAFRAAQPSLGARFLRLPNESLAVSTFSVENMRAAR